MHKFWKAYSAVTAFTGIVGFGSPAIAEVTFEWATVGSPRNAADAAGCGSVANEYRIAKFEVTNDQFTEFLNAVAATDTNSLFSTFMGSDPRGGITQSGVSGSFTYNVKANMGSKPVNYVSFFDAMRFVNWLQNGQPAGDQNAATTEAGVYTISDGLSEARSAGTQFFIPTEDEWYKAAYYQPSADGGDADDYWRYPTGSNIIPTIANANATGDISNPGANVANYDLGADWNGLDGNVTTVGSAGVLSESFYGTSDQGGNVFEWNETVVFGGCCRGLRGGSWFAPASVMRAFDQSGHGPAVEVGEVGFRVASPVQRSADLDADGDVDLIDFGLFQDQFTGAR